MKKPVFDYVDRFMMRSPTWIGRSLKRELKILKLIRYVNKHNKR
jgi:hypothetical protein